MANTGRENYMEAYNHPIHRSEVATVPKQPVGMVVTEAKSKALGPTGLGTWFQGDERNMGGKSLINSQLSNH